MTRRVDDHVNFQGPAGRGSGGRVGLFLAASKMLVERAIEEVKKGPSRPAQDAPEPNEPPKSPPANAEGGAGWQHLLFTSALWNAEKQRRTFIAVHFQGGWQDSAPSICGPTALALRSNIENSCGG